MNANWTCELVIEKVLQSVFVRRLRHVVEILARLLLNRLKGLGDKLLALRAPQSLSLSLGCPLKNRLGLVVTGLESKVGNRSRNGRFESSPQGRVRVRKRLGIKSITDVGKRWRVVVVKPQRGFEVEVLRCNGRRHCGLPVVVIRLRFFEDAQLGAVGALGRLVVIDVLEFGLRRSSNKALGRLGKALGRLLDVGLQGNLALALAECDASSAVGKVLHHIADIAEDGALRRGLQTAGARRALKVAGRLVSLVDGSGHILVTHRGIGDARSLRLL